MTPSERISDGLYHIIDKKPSPFVWTQGRGSEDVDLGTEALRRMKAYLGSFVKSRVLISLKRLSSRASKMQRSLAKMASTSRKSRLHTV